MDAVDVFEKAIIDWRDNKGIGTALIPNNLNDKIMVLGILQRVYARSPTCDTLVITQDFTQRRELIDFITHQDCEENNKEFDALIKSKKLKFVTFDFAAKMLLHTHNFMCIVYRPIEVSSAMITFLNNAKFKLVIINSMLASESMSTLYKSCPILDSFKHNEVEAIRLSTPVEEMQIGVEIPANSEDFKLYNYYTEYITTSINIFGSFEIMQQCRTGNAKLNISANQLCAKIASENGWNENLDMSIEFNIELDKLYNPMSLKDRAINTYEIIRNRGQLLSDYNGKLDKILEIVNANRDKKILIINKRGDFANVVTDYINCDANDVICGNYHDKLDNIPAVDVNGLPLYYKSGANKGERRMMGAAAQQTLNKHLFNIDKLSVLSTGQSPNKNLDVNVDIVIITSPQCESIKTYIYKLVSLRFPNNLITLYSIYCKNTIEQRLLERKETAINHRIINNSEINIVSGENSDFIIVD